MYPHICIRSPPSMNPETERRVNPNPETERRCKAMWSRHSSHEASYFCLVVFVFLAS